ncbi:MAG: protein kinase [Pseudomonadota bacterium]
MSAEALPRTFGPYTLIKLLARGGMGEIYLARTTGLAGFQKYCAVKKLLEKFTHDNDVTTRFIDEAKLGARLCHPNVVQVSDLGRIGDELYMAAEFVDGFDLRRILRFCHEKKKRIPLDTALFVVREILSGLAYAHKQVDAEGRRINLIHRDISPQNVLVSFEGEVKIIDFGLAKSTQRSQETQANVLLGNFGYMSPEQARGKKLDERTDVYSVGIVLFELVTGTKRFIDDNPMSLLEKVAHPAPLMPSERAEGVPTEVDAMYARAVDADLERRYRDAAHFRDEVTRVLHRINPRAAREHLAGFLEHLFLGGPAPQTHAADDDPLNKSVSLAVADLVASSPAFTASKENDLKNRAMGAFDDNSPQTQEMPLLRAARLGDALDEGTLLGRDPEPMAQVEPVVTGSADPANRAPQLAHDDVPEVEPPTGDSARESTDPANRAPVVLVEPLQLDLPDSSAFDQPEESLAATEIHDAPALDDDEPTRVGSAPPPRAGEIPPDAPVTPAALEFEELTPVIEDDFLSASDGDIEIDAPAPTGFIQVKPPRVEAPPARVAPPQPPPLPSFKAPRAPTPAPQAAIPTGGETRQPAHRAFPVPQHAVEDEAIEIDVEEAPPPLPQSLTSDLELPAGDSQQPQDPFHESLIIDFDDVVEGTGAGDAAGASLPRSPQSSPGHAGMAQGATRPPPLPSGKGVSPRPGAPAGNEGLFREGARIRPAASVRPLRPAISSGTGVVGRSRPEPRRKRDDRPVLKRDETADRSNDDKDKS